ncbi:MAG: ROK family protein [Sphingobacteriaceae bacterium]|nr:ROK family protein [Sphingobacteriaceae bacterium]
MIKYVVGVEIHVKRVEVAIIDLESKQIVPGTNVQTAINAMESAENLLSCWTDAINESLKIHGSEVSHIGIAVPGPFDYDKGIFLIQNLQKFDALYQMNIKELLSERLNIPKENIRTANNSPCFLHGEVLHGAAKGYNNVLGFILSSGFGSARYTDGVATDADLWKVHFKNSIANDYLDIKWISQRYKEFTGMDVTELSELTKLAKTDDGIGQLVFGEYGENFATFLAQYASLYDSDLVLVGGYTDAWGQFLQHVKDRMEDRRIKVPIKQAVLGDAAILIGAACQWI